MEEIKNIYFLVGSSASGKSIIQTMLEKSRGLKGIRSYTTRPKRYDNEDDTHIFVSSEEEFLKLKDDMVAYTYFNGNHYGVTNEQIDENNLYIIDPKGIEYYKSHSKSQKPYKIIYIKSFFNTRYERMMERYKKDNGYNLEMDSEKRIEIIEKGCKETCQRLINDILEFKDFEDKADFVVENNNNDMLVDVVNKIWQYIRLCEKEGE